ncbi:hypothetical protein [Zeimonas arvi]|uniref:Uncharacterized protein n=1 Tax=Zeimonas arvi TaxID=2498847 RepID=A0A5C8P0J0_9BURK|nr:hypothetical protein [Zeimonas arvi]TXL66882.1 hypothetical protein FHP08_04440 [Zeimonas arvi]
MSERSDDAVERETLYAEVWTDPMTVVAERYGLSDVGLAKLCKRYAIPVPSRGYWAKVKAGRIMGRPPLPALPPSVPATTTLTPLSTEQRKKRTVARNTVKRVKASYPKIEVPADLVAPHPLVREASKRLKHRDGWDSPPGLRSAPKEVLHLEVSRESLDRALRLVDTLIKALEVSDVTVHVDSQAGETVLKSAGAEVPLTITEKVTWTEHVPTRTELRARRRYGNSYLTGEVVPYPHIPRVDPNPTGRLTITVGYKYGGRNWNDTERKPLEDRMGEVVAGVIAFVELKRAEEAERARREEARRMRPGNPS